MIRAVAVARLSSDREETASNQGQVRRSSAAATGDLLPLGQGAKGMRGVVVRVGVTTALEGRASALDPAELERRLLEIGFVEGAQVEILHEGAIGRDPIGVRLDDMRVALRRREADAVLVRIEAAPVAPRKRS